MENKKKKIKLHSNTKFLSIFNGRNKNHFRQSTPTVIGDMLNEVGIVLPVKDIAKNLKQLLPDEASHAIQRARVDRLSHETVVAGLKLMAADTVSSLLFLLT